jgi:ubiquinone/menaquinone biosynthesis C-methylase UbiE
LSSYFDRVIATDASSEQLSHAEPAPRIEYRVAPAESSGLPDKSVDLVTVAQALHWLNAELFFNEVKRILAPGGAIAVWGYGDPVLDTPELQSILHQFNRGTIESYWLPERQLILDGYLTIPFPFDEIAVPRFKLSRELTLPALIGYVRTWSATARYIADHGTAALDQLEIDSRVTLGRPQAGARSGRSALSPGGLHDRPEV